MAKHVVARDVYGVDEEGRQFKRRRRVEIDTASQEELFAVIAEAEETKARAWVRLMAPKAVQQPDQALNAREVAERIGMGKDWVYAHAAEIPGLWENGKGIKRWSAAAVEAWKMREGKRKEEENG